MRRRARRFRSCSPRPVHPPLNGTGPMTMLRFGPLLAIAGAACLVAWTPEGRPPPPEVATLDRVRLALRHRADRDSERRRGRRPSVRRRDLGDHALRRFRRWRGVRTAERAPRLRPRLPGATRTSRSNSLTPTLRARRRRSARPPRPRRPRGGSGTVRAAAGPRAVGAAADPALPPPPPISQAAILYRKGDVAGLTALAGVCHRHGRAIGARMGVFAR